MTSCPRSLRHAHVLFFALVVAPVARAVQPHVPEGLSPSALAQLGEPPRISPAIDADESKQWAATDPAFRAFVAEAGIEWSARWDRRTGHLSFASGSFPAWLPADHRVHEADEISATRALLEQDVRALMARHPGLLAIPSSATLILDEARSVPVDEGRIWQIDYRVELGGVPVSGAHVSFRLNSGRLVQLGQQGIADVLELAGVAPRIDAGQAASRSTEELIALLYPAAKEASVEGDSRLELLPMAADPWRFDGAVGSGMDYRLAWRTSLTVPGRIESWVMIHDAVTGARLFVFDSNRYACSTPSSPQGRVVGGIWPGPIEEVTETIHALPHARVNNGGGVDADGNGVFPFTVGQSATTTLSGQYFDMNCAGCNTPAQAFATSQAPGPLSLGVGGNDATGNGISTRAERNCFYHLNVIREIVAKHLSDAATNGFLTQRTDATVNINQSCNAYYDGSVNFYRSSGQCNNTGEIADVMQHEWGHGLDDHTGGIQDGGMSEGVGDVVAFLGTHESRMSPYFFRGDAGGLRNADENVVGVRTWTQVDGLCPGREVHCVGEIFTQPWWHLARNLRNRSVGAGGGEAAGWYLAERIFFEHLPVADTMDPAGANNMYDAATLVDDDDGNLANGVPDGTEINDAFSHHAFVSPPQVADSADCAPPPAPAVGLSPAIEPTTTNWRVTVSWTAVPGAAEYRVFRNETGSGAEMPIATVPAPGLSFQDDDVADATTYRYRVMAFLPNGCFSIGENVQSTTIPDRVLLSLATMAVDDAAAGNSNGAAEPGETIDLVVTVRNISGIAATNIVGTMTTTHPGVTVVRGTQDFATIGAGATGTGVLPRFSIALSRSLVACPDTIPLSFSFEATEGCSAADVTLNVGPPPVLDDLETDRGWSVDPTGGDSATTGIWTRVAPIATTYQVGADHTPGAGKTMAFITGSAVDPGGNDGLDDVDGGCTTLQSPVYDMAGVSGLTLSYWRAWAIATAFDDEFVVQISNDGGGAWTELERFGTSTTGFEQASFALDAVLGAPAGQIALRFTACDQGAGSLLEAAVDDITFTGFPCVPPDPQPRLVVSTVTIGDSGIFGGAGNGDGTADPGEAVRLPIELRNLGNAAATLVSGTLSVAAGPASASDPAATWPDIAVAQAQLTAGAPAHFQISIPQGATCGSMIDLVLDVSHDGPSGTYSLRHPFTLMVGRNVETVAFSDDFEGGDNGVTHFDGVAGGGNCAQNLPCDDWHHGPCTGVSTWDPPDTVVPGGSIWGTDLGGDRGGPRPFDGNYKNDCCATLEFPPIDCTGLSGLKLSFLRWLTVEGGTYDHARVLINGNVVWENPANGDLLDTAWVPVEYDVSALADNNPSVVIRFDLQSDGGLRYGGWSIDDLRLLNRSTQCVPFDNGGCGAPPVPPATGPVLRATTNYDTNGAEYSWIGAPLGAMDEYRLYRGIVPTALDTLVTPAGHVATSFDDRLAPGPLYYYRLVIANCLGQEGPADP